MKLSFKINIKETIKINIRLFSSAIKLNSYTRAYNIVSSLLSNKFTFNPDNMILFHKNNTEGSVNKRTTFNTMDTQNVKVNY